MSSILSPLDVMTRGLGYIGISQEEQARMLDHDKVEDFKAHNGSSPLVIAAIWHDLQDTSIKEAKLEKEEKSVKGFKWFMIAHFFLWTYPKNVNLMKTRFKICK
jgi:predicted GIY-YIG superfamily endonuclease